MTPSTTTSRQRGPRGRRRARRSRRIFTLRNGLIAAGLLAVAFALQFTEFEWRDIPAWLQQVNRPLALLMMATLPVFGFSVGAVYLAIGALFGPAWGGLVVAGITIVHVSLTHVLAKTLLKRQVARWHAAWVRRFPNISQGDHASVAAMIVIVPGLPYFVRNCLLAVAGVPLRFVYGIALPLYVARAYTTLYLGNLGQNPSPRAWVILGAIFVVKLSASAFLFWRLRSRAVRHKRSHAASHGAAPEARLVPFPPANLPS